MNLACALEIFASCVVYICLYHFIPEFSFCQVFLMAAVQRLVRNALRCRNVELPHGLQVRKGLWYTTHQTKNQLFGIWWNGNDEFSYKICVSFPVIFLGYGKIMWICSYKNFHFSSTNPFGVHPRFPPKNLAGRRQGNVAQVPSPWLQVVGIQCWKWHRHRWRLQVILVANQKWNAKGFGLIRTPKFALELIQVGEVL